MKEPAVQINKEVSDEGTMEEDIPIVYLDLATSGFQRNCDILQMAAKCGKNSFNVYITPNQEISAAATAVHGLRKCQAELILYGKPVPSVPPRPTITNLYQWLILLKKKCYIAVHNLSFDRPRLIDLITVYSLSKEFADIIVGFIDTLQVIKKETYMK